MAEFKDNLPLDGRVKINWKGAAPEFGTYVGFEAGNTRRCAVRPEGCANLVWIDRAILEDAE